MADLLSVVIGGALAISGGAGSQWYQHKLRTREERRKLKAEKVEELVAKFHEVDHWLDNQRKNLVFGEDITETPSPFAKLESIVIVHFPQFKLRMREYGLETTKYRQWMLGRARKRLEKNMAELGNGFEDAYKNYLNKRDQLRDEIVAYAEKEFSVGN